MEAKPCLALQTQLDVYMQTNSIQDRLGIRVRVTEQATDGRRPHRVKAELDAVLTLLCRIPSYARVFIATDSDYIQQTLLSHFIDSRFLPKKFDQRESTGGYVHRTDKEAMFTFLKEVCCLCACRKVINIGGFLNDGTIRSKIIEAPYDEAAFLHVRRV